jgi:hypothetical protein
MNDPFCILNEQTESSNDDDGRTPRSISMISTESVASVMSIDEETKINLDDFNSNTTPMQSDDYRASMSVPKNERPPQPADEREYFERLWAQNFERSEVRVNCLTDYIPIGAAGRLNRIKGFSFARDIDSNKLYAVFRLEIECIVNEKQWTIYRRFHDFKQLAQQLKNEVFLLLFCNPILTNFNSTPVYSNPISTHEDINEIT